MQGLMIVLMVLLNLGGIVTVVFNIGQGHLRWLADLITLVVLDAIGFYLLRVARSDP